MSSTVTTAGGRVAWAIEQSGYKLEALAEEIGCTHATLSQWKNEHTDLTRAKVTLVLNFCSRTGVNPNWLVTGNGPALDSYAKGGPALMVRAQELLKHRPELAPAAERMLEALQGTPTGV